MAALPSGHAVEKIVGKELDDIHDKFPSFEKLIRLNPGGWFFPELFQKYDGKIFNFEVKPSDVYVMTYPKVGTTWTQEIVWTMKYNPNLDHPDRNTPILDRSPFMDADMLFPEDMPPEMASSMEPMLKAFRKHCPGADPRDGANVQLAGSIPEPRILKSHLPLTLMPPNLLDKAKVIYVARNPRDVVCSYYHHCRLFNEMKFTGTLDEFCEYFLNDNLIYSPYWLHVKEAWEKRHHPNMHVMLYEDMKADIMGELRKLNAFLGTNLTEKQLEGIKHYTSFDEMKNREGLVEETFMKNPMIVNLEVYEKDGGFFRQGKTGDGKKRLSPESQVKMDNWIKKHFNFGLNY